MSIKRELLTDIFVRLGRKLENFGRDDATNAIITEAGSHNEWFTRADVLQSVEAIRSRMLERKELHAWLAAYPEIREPKNIGVIMAGNIPLVGFFDLLCVIISGHNCYVKPSSKDSVLTNYIIGLLREICPEIPVTEYDGQVIDAVIATGSDNTNRYFRSRFGDMPAIFRGNRASAAVLTGGETAGDIEGLAKDMFSYSGLGCRNVSHLLLPEGYDVAKLAAGLSGHPLPNAKYFNNFMQRRAILKMQGALKIKGSTFTEGKFFILREDGTLPLYLSEITYHVYRDENEASDWIDANNGRMQCVVGNPAIYQGAVAFGQSQYPNLGDYPDRVDVMDFLARL